MDTEKSLNITFNATEPGCIGILSARYGENGICTEHQFPIANSEKREEFILKVCSKCPGVNPDSIRQKLENLAADAATNAGKFAREKLTQADLLLKLAERAEFFTHNDIEYATVQVESPKSHRETYRIRDKQFKRWLSNLYYRQTGRGIGASAMQDVIENLCGKAANSGISHKVAIRIAESGGNVYLDLGNAEWEAIEITPDKWSVISNPPIRFIRNRAIQEIPIPVHGGNIDELRLLLNIPNDETWRLIIGWIIGALNPKGPYPILAVNGEQGSAKSTMCRMIRRLIDPNLSDLRTAPRDERELFIAACNSRILAFDNISTIRNDMSDALCRISTGGGFSSRKLYDDDTEVLITACCPQIFNGIEEIATRPDLLERCIVIHLPTIPDHRRATESEISRQFEEIRPRVLGAICDAISSALRERNSIKLEKPPRMADFAVWVCAAERALGWPAGTFLNALESNRGAANGAAIEGSEFAQVIIAFMENRPDWSGTSTELLREMQSGELSDSKVWDRRGLPKTAQTLSGQLDRIAPTLRRWGIQVDREREGKGRKRIIHLERAVENASASSASAAIPILGSKTLYPKENSHSLRPVADGSANLAADKADEADGISLANSAYAGGF